MSWLYLMFAGLLEVGGVISLKMAEGFTKMKPSLAFVIFMGSSFVLLSLSLKEIPISIGYGIWTGIGAAGSVLLGMFIFKERKDLKKLIFVGGIIGCIVGLKLLS
ncbi:multidrug efflux SMR transporter [Halobacillus kuroshimensis]|uniref:Multidrug efflux SMR transporter n=1 Tax=Halobacillus kuroshimensis TaxID=302481 RepID=A0ABS3DYG9_9BACI|nr:MULTISPECIES: multidrug efflux SMR transporter [Halobacillus]MBN8236373.1 multidrug efflux SMR transporter [Halobacillus kuroshimensis]